jgi:hypothetical protein
VAGAVGGENSPEGIGPSVGERVVAHHRLGRRQAEGGEVFDRSAQHGRRGVPAWVEVLLDVGVAGVVVDHAVQVDVPHARPLLGAGLVTNAGDRMPGTLKARQRAMST